MSIKNEMINKIKTLIGVRFLRLMYDTLAPIVITLRKMILKVVRTRTYNHKSNFLALGERIEYNFPKHWICVDWEGADFNIDLKKMDSLPFQDESMRLIYTAHLLEHLGYDAVQRVLKECFRVLRNGGGIRIEVPDANLFLEAYKNKDHHFLQPFLMQQKNIVERFGIPEKEKYLQDHMVVMNCLSHSYPSLREIGGIKYCNVNLPVVVEKHIFDQQYASLPLKDFFSWTASLQTDEQLATGGHQCGFNFPILSEMLASAGFKNIVQSCAETSGFEELGIGCGENVSKMIHVKPDRKAFSLYVEAIK